MTSPSSLNRSRTERFLHAVLFEGIAIVLCSPVVAWAMEKPTERVGVLTIVFSLMAMAWNVVFNAGFDRWQRHARFERNWIVRIGHGIAFELGLILGTVPFAAWWLGIGLWPAFLLDAGLLLFFVPYTVLFNWSYDTLRARVVQGTAAHRDRGWKTPP